MEAEKKKIPYFPMIKESLILTWNNRYLWWFGFFIVLSGIGGNFFQFSPQKSEIKGQTLIDFVMANQKLVFFILVGLMLIWIIFLYLGLVSKGALIKLTYLISEKKESNFKMGLKEGRKYFWKVFFISFISGLFILATLIVFIIPIGFLFYNKSIVLGVLLSLLALIIFIPVIFIISFVRMYAYIYAVLSDLSIGESLENAYALLQKNIVPSLIVTLIFLSISALATVLALAIIIPSIIVFVLIGMLLFFLAKDIGVIITLLAALPILIVILLLGGSIYQVFSQTFLVIFFKNIATPKITEEVETEKIVELGPAHATDPVVGN